MVQSVLEAGIESILVIDHQSLIPVTCLGDFPYSVVVRIKSKFVRGEESECGEEQLLFMHNEDLWISFCGLFCRFQFGVAVNSYSVHDKLTGPCEPSYWVDIYWHLGRLCME